MKLTAGVSYWHINDLFIRTIDRIEGDTVLWHDQHGSGTCSTKIFNRQCYRPVEEGEQAPTRPPKVVIPKVSSSELKFQELCREAKKNNFNHITIESVAELGANYEEITANLEVIRKQRIYFRIL